MGTVTVLIGIILVAGVLGGVGAHLAASDEAPPEGTARSPCALRYVVLGLIASAAVPMFLNLLQSDILNDFFNDQTHVQSAFILFGFCAIAAFSARAFIDRLSVNILQQVQRNTETANAALQKAGEAEEKAIIATENVTDLADRDTVPPPMRVEAMASAEAVVPRRDLGADEQRVLERMMDMSFRTATGVANDIPGLTRPKVADVLATLAARGLVERTLSPKTGSPRWRITPAGLRTLNTDA